MLKIFLQTTEKKKIIKHAKILQACIAIKSVADPEGVHGA